MGIGSTVKNMLSTDGTTVNGTGDRPVDTRGSTSYEKRDSGDRSSRQLPPGTGPGTSGKPAVASERPMQSDVERSRTGQDTSGYGTDAAAAMGGTLAGTHQGSSLGNSRTAARNTTGFTTATGISSDAAASSRYRDSSMSGDRGITGGQATSATKASALDSGTEGAMRETVTNREPIGQGLVTGVGPGGFLEDEHIFGHTKHAAPEDMPPGTTSQLHPVVHERVRHLEFEEVAHVRNHERHVHHIQHHTQPVIVPTEELQERLRDNPRPVTHVKEIHSNKPDDSTILGDQIYENRDSLFHVEKERKVIDKGTTVNEIVHHHVHHVIQPVIEKETIEKERIRTTVPIHHVTHEAPVVHQPQKHEPVLMELFLKGGGNPKSGVPQDEIVNRVLHHGRCTREIDGVAHSPGDMNKDI